MIAIIIAISTVAHPMRAATMSGSENPVESVNSLITERIPTSTVPGIKANNNPQDTGIGLRVKRKMRVDKAQISPPIPKCAHLSIPQDLK